MATRTYAVKWWQEGKPPRVGKLELRQGVAGFSARGAEPVAIDLDDVVDVGIARSEAPPAESRPTLVLWRRGAPSILVQSVLGVGVLHELAESFASRSWA